MQVGRKTPPKPPPIFAGRVERVAVKSVQTLGPAMTAMPPDTCSVDYAPDHGDHRLQAHSVEGI